MLLDVSNLDVRYGRTHAVKNVSLTVQEAEIVTVLGRTAPARLRCCARSRVRCVPRLAGSCSTARDLTGASPAARVRGGMMLVPEGRQIFVSMTVHENLQMGVYLRKDREVARDLDAVYDRFPNLAERRDMKASVLSGGEQQMLAIGRALVGRPRLILLDEPSLGLAPLFVSRLFDLIVELNRTRNRHSAGRAEHRHGARDCRARLCAGARQRRP